MNKIQNYALANEKVSLVNLAAVIDELHEKHGADVDHLLSIILGFEDIPKEFPEKSSVLNAKHIGKFKEYRILEDIVFYEYTDVLKLWFKNQEDADRFSNGEPHYHLDYVHSWKEGYEYEGVKTYIAGSYCSRKEWMDGALTE